MKPRSIVDILTDETCCDVVYLHDAHNRAVAFEQIALIPFDNQMYAILAEQSAFARGACDDCALVVRLDYDADDIEIVESDEIVSEVFSIYDRLFEEREQD
mgnify:CR=1 FL=1